MNPNGHILLVDDDLELCELLAIRLRAAGYEVSVEHDVGGALSRIGRERVDAVLLDLRLGNEDGFVVLDGVAKRSADVPVVILTAHGTIDLAVEAMQKGAYGFITKPFHHHDLLQKLKHTVESHKLRQEVAGLRRIVGEPEERQPLVGVSAAVDRVREMITLVAPTDATILVLGESGTGKEIVARSIHALSPRGAAGRFVAVNCAGLSAELLESTLFGHRRGAFTGAVSDREGLFGAAQRGTLFLDEIAETPLDVQAKLLLVSHSWPGNVRELENVMEAAVLLCRTGEVDLEHLPGVGMATNPPADAATADLVRSAARLLSVYAPPDAASPPPLREAREAFERASLDMILQRSNGNVTAAAKLAGRNRTDFYDLMRRHGRSPQRIE